MIYPIGTRFTFTGGGTWRHGVIKDIMDYKYIIHWSYFDKGPGGYDTSYDEKDLEIVVRGNGLIVDQPSFTLPEDLFVL